MCESTLFEVRCDLLDEYTDVTDYQQYIKFDNFCTANNLSTKDKMMEFLPQESLWMMGMN